MKRITKIRGNSCTQTQIITLCESTMTITEETEDEAVDRIEEEVADVAMEAEIPRG